jgi:hypothetical protein
MYNMLIPTRKMKPAGTIKYQLEKGIVCQAPGCGENLTIYEGAGSDSYCNTHQLRMKEHGGMARPDRPYTFHKSWCCAWCNYDPREDKRFDRMTDEVKKLSAQSATLICDHIITRQKGKLLGWTDEKIDAPENIQTLCQICEKIKSAEEGDWLREREILED